MMDFLGWCLVGLLTISIAWQLWHAWKLQRHSRKSQQVWHAAKPASLPKHLFVEKMRKTHTHAEVLAKFDEAINAA